MAFVHSKSSRIALGARNYSCLASSLSVTVNDDLSDVTTLCNSGRTMLSGLDDGSMSITYFADDLADGSAWSTQFGEAKNVVTYAPAGFAAGNTAICMAALETQHTPGSSISDAVAFELAVQSQGSIDGTGVMLIDASSTALTATGQSASVDNGASSANGGAAYLHVFSAGTGSMSAFVQDSSDNSTWSNLATFTAATGATSQRVEVTGTVDRYLRFAYAISGGSPAFLVVAAFARR